MLRLLFDESRHILSYFVMLIFVNNLFFQFWLPVCTRAVPVQHEYWRMVTFCLQIKNWLLLTGRNGHKIALESFVKRESSENLRVFINLFVVLKDHLKKSFVIFCFVSINPRAWQILNWCIFHYLMHYLMSFLDSKFGRSFERKFSLRTKHRNTSTSASVIIQLLSVIKNSNGWCVSNKNSPWNKNFPAGQNFESEDADQKLLSFDFFGSSCSDFVSYC